MKVEAVVMMFLFSERILASPPSFLYSCLLQDQFFNYVMRGTKGSKMPRGDRRQIMEFVIQAPLSAANEIGSTIFNLQKKFDLLHEINRNLPLSA